MEPRLSEVFGETWWQDRDFEALLGKRGKGIVLRAASDISKRGNIPTSGRMTAELSFGFWTNMLLPKYREPLWNALQDFFPDVPPSLQQSHLHERCEYVRDFRNRISHHEPIFKRNLSSDYSRCVELLRWLGPDKAAWIKPQLDTMKILREKP
jgi:hypothetical protein